MDQLEKLKELRANWVRAQMAANAADEAAKVAAENRFQAWHAYYTLLHKMAKQTPSKQLLQWVKEIQKYANPV